MAAIITALARRKFGNGYLVVADVQFDNSYPTGGEPVTAQQLGLTALDLVQAAPASGYAFEFDHANGKLKAFQFDYTAVAAGPAVEVANLTDLSAVTTRVAALGL